MMSSHSTNQIFFNKDWTSRIPPTHPPSPLTHTNTLRMIMWVTLYMYIFFLVWVFVQAMLIKTILKQDQKEEGRTKAKKINVQGNLNPSNVFLIKWHLNFAVFRISLQVWFMAVFFPSIRKYLNHKYLIVLENMHMFKVF